MNMNPKMSPAFFPSESDEMTPRVPPNWRRRPCIGDCATNMPSEELAEKMDDFFQERFDSDSDEPVAFCDLAGHTGFDSVSQMVNHARRKGGKTMRYVSRALLAVGAGYEQAAMRGSRSALELLTRLPQFDSEEPSEQIPTHPFNPKTEVEMNIRGLARREERGKQLSEQEAYLQLIKHKTYEEMEPEVLDASQDEHGDYAVIEIGDDDD